MKLIDTHIHALDFNAKELKNLIENDKIEQFICVTSHEAEWEGAALLFEQYPHKVIPAFGVHPWYLQGLETGWDNRLEALLQKYPLALVGEIGLDRLKEPEPKLQQEVFAKQLQIAKKLGRAVLIHAVKANEWMEKFWVKMPNKFVFHSYNGKQEFLKKIIVKGGYVSFSPSILKNKLRDELILLVPQNRILIETDAPFQGNVDELFEVMSAVNAAIGVGFDAQIYANTKEFLK